jgi:small subunit ribosomal protein S12
MTTFIQLINKRTIRFRKRHYKRTGALKKCPQKKGIVLKVFTESPKKPNSAKRPVARLRLSTYRIIRAGIPGEKNEVLKFKRVLICGRRVRDLPGIRYRIIPGAADAKGLDPELRKKARSKYGVKKLEKFKKERIRSTSVRELRRKISLLTKTGVSYRLKSAKSILTWLPPYVSTKKI